MIDTAVKHAAKRSRFCGRVPIHPRAIGLAMHAKRAGADMEPDRVALLQKPNRKASTASGPSPKPWISSSGTTSVASVAIAERDGIEVANPEIVA